MRSISIEQITDEMTFQSAKPFTEISVRARTNHKIVTDERANHVGIVYPKGESEEKWDCYGEDTGYFFWKQYNTVQAIRCRPI